jgi:hypothetical protein
MNDLELINRIIAGDTLGFNQLIRNWEKRIYTFVLRFLGCRDEAMDIKKADIDDLNSGKIDLGNFRKKVSTLYY